MNCGADMCECDVVVVGGGPVGLLTACLLADRGLRVTILEKRPGPTTRTMAIGVTPPSLEILRGIGLDQEFVRRGVRVRTAEVHESRRTVGRLRFDDLPSPYPFVLSIPQPDTVELLTRAAASRPLICLRPDHTFESFTQSSERVRVTARDNAGGTTRILHTRFLVG